MKSIELKPFEEKHIEDAAKLFAERHKAERKNIKLLPARHEEYNIIAPLLNDQIKKTRGVVAIENGKLTGYVVEQLIPSWRGRRSAFVPFWAHATTGKNRKRNYQEMYTYLSPQWIANGCHTHLISVPAYDREIINTLFWLGFGMAVIDTMRDVSDIQDPVANVDIRRATVNDLDIVVPLDHALAHYLEGPPIFMPIAIKRGREYHEKWLSKPLHRLWLASLKGEIVSYMKMCPLDEDYLITDEKTMWIQGAYTKEHLRGKGIGSALLKQALKWAQSQGYERCAVDFEAENVLAGAFWLRYFEPTCFSLVRHVNVDTAVERGQMRAQNS